MSKFASVSATVILCSAMGLLMLFMGIGWIAANISSAYECVSGLITDPTSVLHPGALVVIIAYGLPAFVIYRIFKR